MPMERQDVRKRLSEIQAKIQALLRDVNSLERGLVAQRNELVITHSTLETVSFYISKSEYLLAEAIRHENKCIDG